MGTNKVLSPPLKDSAIDVGSISLTVGTKFQTEICIQYHVDSNSRKCKQCHVRILWLKMPCIHCISKHVIYVHTCFAHTNEFHTLDGCTNIMCGCVCVSLMKVKTQSHHAYSVWSFARKIVQPQRHIKSVSYWCGAA